MRTTSPSLRPSTRALPRALVLYLVLLTGLDAIDLIWQRVVNQHFLHRGWPYNSALLQQGTAVDLMAYVHLMPLRRTPEFFTFHSPPFMYPAPVALLYGFFLALKNPVFVFERSVQLLVLATAAFFAWRLWKRGISAWAAAALVVLTAALSYPLAFELRQGNMEAWLVLLVGLGVWCFWKERYHLAAILFGTAAAMKLFPFVYLGLLLNRRRLSPILTGIASAGAITFAGLFYISSSPLRALHQIEKNIDTWRWDVVLKIREEIGYDHSLFSVIKQILFYLLHRHRPSPYLLNTLSHIYMPFVALIGIALWFGRVNRLPFANQVLCLVVASILLPPNSYDYTLLHLYVAGGVLAFVAADAKERAVPGLRAVFCFLALATAYEGELVWNSRVFAGQFKALALVALLVLTAIYPFPMKSELDESRQKPIPANA